MSKGTVNKVFLLGRLGAEPDIKYTPSGVAIANLSLATNDGYKDNKTGKFIEQTEWHRVIVFGKQAETVQQYCHKGALLYIEGRIRTNKWQDKEGNDRYTTEIMASSVQMVGGKQDSSDNNSQPARPSSDVNPYANTKQKGNRPTPTHPQQQPEVPPFDDDDIPF